MEEYKELINGLLEEFKKTLPENGADNRELIEGFNRYITDTVSNLLEDALEDSELTSDFVERVVIAKAADVIKLDYDAKKIRLIEDPILDQLRVASGKIFEQAVLRAEGKEVTLAITDESQENAIGKFEDMLKQVKPHNIEQAKQIYSETILDLNYLKGENDITSLRIGNIIRSNKRSDR